MNPHLEGLSLCQRADQIELLIGQDHAELLMPLEVRSGSDGAPYAVRTTLGWTLHGSVACQSPQPFMCMFTFSDMPEKVSQDDLHDIEHWDANTKTVGGHYEIPVPWIDSTSIPPETRYMAKMCDMMPCVYVSVLNRRSSSFVSFTQFSPTCGRMLLPALSLWPGRQPCRPRLVDDRRGGGPSSVAPHSRNPPTGRHRDSPISSSLFSHGPLLCAVG